MLLGDLVALQTGPFGSSLHQSDYVAKGVPLVNPMHIVGGRIRATEEHTVSPETAQRLLDFRLSAGDVVIGRRGEMGRCAVVTPREYGWLCGTGSMVIRCGDALVPTFLQRLLSSREIVEYLGQESVGSTMANLNQKVLLSVPIRVPPIAEQHRIVDAIDELMPDHEAGVAELNVALSKLSQHRQSLLKAAVEGDLTAEWRASNPPQETGAELLARILRERRARCQARQRKFVAPVAADAEDAKKLQGGWTLASIDELAEVGTGVTPLRTNSQYFDGGSIPWVTSGALNAERVATASMLVTEAALAECRLVMYPAGSLLVAMYGEGKTRGKCAELGIAATINQAIAALVFEGSAVACREYVKAFLWNSYERMRQQASGGVQPNLNLRIIKSLAVPLPPLAEQEAIVVELNLRLEGVSASEAAIAHGLRMAAAQRQNILRAAFSGQLVPQDPNDEPASVLLERIRTERAAASTASPRPLPRRRARQSAAT